MSTNPPRPPGPPLGPGDPRRRPSGPGRLEGPPPGPGRPPRPVGAPGGPGRLEGPPPGPGGPPPGPGGPGRRSGPPPAPRGPRPAPSKRPQPADTAPVVAAAAGGGATPPRPPRGSGGSRGGNGNGNGNGDGSGRSARRAAARRRTRRRAFAIGAAVVLLAGGAAAFALSSGTQDTQTAFKAKRKVAPTTTTTVPKFEPSTTLTSTVDQLTAYEQPDESSPVVGTFSKLTDYKQPRTLLAVNTQPGWYQALLPMRPNGAMGWVREADVLPGKTTYEIRISVSRHYLALLNEGEVVLEAPTVVGKPETPTPLGKFYITDPVDLQSRPNGAYGAYALGISGYSEVLKTFNGGPGQIAIHGNGQQNTVGTDISNGCIRIFNDLILQIAKAVPLGTPVIIEA